MKVWSFGALVVAAIVVTATLARTQPPSGALDIQVSVAHQSEIPAPPVHASLPSVYQEVPKFFKMPGGRILGGWVGIEIDRDGSSIWVLETCSGDSCASDVNPVLKFDASGNFVTTWGAGMFVFPHGFYVDWEGNIWITDGRAEGGRGHQVFKFTPEGKRLLALGTAGATGEGPYTFNYVSDVVVGRNGDIFVADGHGGETNARIVKFSKDGKFLKTWGKLGSAPGEINTPHAIAMDSRGRVVLADRGNQRIQIFDGEGTLLENWRLFGRPSGLYIDQHDMLYVADTTGSSNDKRPEAQGWEFGIRIGSMKDGKVTAIIRPSDVEFEQVAVDAKGNVFTTDRAIHRQGIEAIRKYVRK